MLPGLGRGVNPHKMKRMMKQMGINIEELDDVEQIIIRTSNKKYVFGSDVSVSIMTAQGQKTFQITGDPKVLDRSEWSEDEMGTEDRVGSAEKDEDEGFSIPEGDIQLVCDQTGVSEEEAKAALKACNGNPAEAILKLMDN